MPALRRATDLPMQTIVATSLAVIALVSVGGVLASAIGGHVDWHIALPFAAGALAGMLTGRGFSRHLAGPALQQGFAAFAGVVAIGLVVRALA
uniref:Probable membrane transporter protein n=1 Tax=Ralstonia solanacearum TaxID=305 RepID=A0A0S4VSV9_RALSL